MDDPAAVAPVVPADPVGAPIRVFLLVDHELGRCGIADLLASAGERRWSAKPAPSPRHCAVYPAVTDRERETLAPIADGLTNRQIGQRLFLAEETEKNYASALLAQLGRQRRTQVAVQARRFGRAEASAPSGRVQTTSASKDPSPPG